LQNKEKILISKTIGKNGSVKEVMQWFSLLRAEGEAILVFIHQQITSVCYRKPRNDACF